MSTTSDRALAALGRPLVHRVPDTSPTDIPAAAELAYLGMGCFWGAEKLLWSTPGVVSTQVGYLGGHTVNPSYREVCTGATGHAEVVQVYFDPDQIGFRELLRVFFENHDPTQGERQGNDVGSQYRSVIFTTSDDQYSIACQLRDDYQRALTASGYGPITTQIEAAGQWYPAEDYHQRYLEKNPDGYCPVHATGVRCD